MSNLREAAQAALDALVIRCGTNAEERCPNGAITALRAALAKPQPEPVIAEWQARVGNRGAWRRVDATPSETLRQRVEYLKSLGTYELRALYAAPQAQRPLTEDPTNKYAINVPGYGWVDTKAVRAIERAHGIGVKS